MPALEVTPRPPSAGCAVCTTITHVKRMKIDIVFNYSENVRIYWHAFRFESETQTESWRRGEVESNGLTEGEELGGEVMSNGLK